MLKNIDFYRPPFPYNPLIDPQTGLPTVQEDATIDTSNSDRARLTSTTSGKLVHF